MVDITDKEITKREATATSMVKMLPTTLQKIKEGKIGKGDVLSVAQVAGIMAAKKTSEWIPMCHPLALSGVNITFTDNDIDELYIMVTVKITGKTGVEMEALTAASATALTIYDMCKALQKDMIIGPTQLMKKTGGVHGDFERVE